MNFLNTISNACNYSLITKRIIYIVHEYIQFAYNYTLIFFIIKFTPTYLYVVIPLTNMLESRPMRLLPPQHKSSLSPCEGEKEVSCK